MSEQVSEVKVGGGWVVLLRLLLIAGLGMSLFLLWQGLGDGAGIAGCGPGSGCGEVLISKWSKWFGVPTGGLAAGLYLVMLAVSLRLKKLGQDGLMILMAGAVMIVGAAVWFGYLQYAVLEKFCKYCMLTHAIGFFVGGTVVYGLMKHTVGFTANGVQDEIVSDGQSTANPMYVGTDRGTRTKLVVAVLAGMFGVGVLVGGQVMQKEPDDVVVKVVPGGGGFDTGPAAGDGRQLGVLRGKVRLNVKDYPLLGAADAEYVIVLLFDYTCEHCRTLHGYLLEAIEKYEGKLAVVALPVAMDGSCNEQVPVDYVEHEAACEHARMATVMWLSGGQKMFDAFDTFVLQSDTPYGGDLVRAYVKSMLGTDELERIESSGQVEHWLGRIGKVYALAGKGAIPKLLAVRGRLTGAPDDFEQFEQWLAEVVGIGGGDEPEVGDLHAEIE